MPGPDQNGSNVASPHAMQNPLSNEKTTGEGERYRTLLEINNAVISNLTHEPLFRGVTQALRRVIPFDRTGIFLHDPGKDVLRLSMLESSLPSQYFHVGLEMAAAESHVGWVFQHRQPLLRRDLESKRQYPMEDRAFADGVRSYVIVPLIARAKTIGTLAVASTRANQYSEADAMFLQEVANQVALAVENMKAYEEIASLNARAATIADRYRSLLEINNAIISNLTREALFRAITQALRRVVPSDRTSIFLHDPQKDVLQLFVLESSLPSEHLVVGWEEGPQKSNVGWVFQHRQPLLRHDLQTERQFPTEDLSLADGVRSYVVVPLNARGRCMGTLSVASTKPNQYSEADAAFLQDAASQITLAVENMKSYEEAQQEIALRRRAEESLREMFQFTQEIISGANEGIIVYDAALRYVVFNRFMEDLTGKRAEEVLGKYAPDVFPFLREKGMEAMLKRALKGETVTCPDVLIRMPTGREVWELNRYAPHRDAQGNIIGVIALVSDITQRKQAEEALRNALAEVERLKNRLQAENVYLQEEIRREHDFAEMVGNSPALLGVLRRVEQVAAADSMVLISGETGTGKELIARAIHSRSARKDRPLVKVNCSAISAGLVESELFGHMKGAFTGALERRIGRFELADGGTILLDEVGELPLETQVKLLRVLQEGEFEPVGSSKTIRVDVRVIAATNRDLQQAVQAGRFRSDLYYRLNVFPLEVPPLRDRKSDIPQLVMFFLSRFAKKFAKPVDTVTQETMDRLMSYPWPGNIREVQNIIERAVVLSQGSSLRLGPDLLPAEGPDTSPREEEGPGHGAPGAVRGAKGEPSLPRPIASGPSSLEEVERHHILEILDRTGGVIEGARGAAKILNLHPNTLRSRMKKLGIRRPSHEIS
jgi:formate hydrogenlyase transcriptional activator